MASSDAAVPRLVVSPALWTCCQIRWIEVGWPLAFQVEASW